MRLILSCVVLGALGVLALRGQAGDEPERTDPREQVSRLVTMYKADPLTHAISLGTGRPGAMMQRDGVYNVNSDLDYGNYNENAFTVGIEGGREGSILDLGTGEAMGQETVGGGQNFAALRLDGEDLVGKDGRVLGNARALLSVKDRRGSTAPTHVGHIYLVRLTDSHDAKFERIAKLLVVGHDAGESVTVRWVILRDTPGSSRD